MASEQAMRAAKALRQAGCLDPVHAAVNASGAADLIDEATGLPELVAFVSKTAAWFERLAKQHEREAETYRGRFDTLADACRHDAKNYRAVLADAKAALAKAGAKG